MRILLVCSAVLLCGTVASSQLNFTAGYRASFTNPEAFNAIIDTHNLQIENAFKDSTSLFRYTSQFNNVKYLNGFELGVRYKMPGVIFHMGWMNKRRQIKADVRRLNGSTFDNRITTSIQAISVGIQPSFGIVSVGATIDYNWLKLKTDLEQFENTGLFRTFTDNAWSTHFSVSFNFGNSGVIGATIQPFVQLNWGSYDITEFRDALLEPGKDPSTPQGTFTEKFNTFGISLIINNGQQSGK